MDTSRTEHDAFGPVEIPADRYWGAQTQRALGVFEVGEERFPACLIHAFGLQKMAAARANLRCGALKAVLAEPILAAAAELRDGRFDAYGQQLDIERGFLTFQGLLDDPALDVRAVRKGLSVEPGVQVGGTAGNSSLPFKASAANLYASSKRILASLRFLAAFGSCKNVIRALR